MSREQTVGRSKPDETSASRQTRERPEIWIMVIPATSSKAREVVADSCRPISRKELEAVFENDWSFRGSLWIQSPIWAAGAGNKLVRLSVFYDIQARWDHGFGHDDPNEWLRLVPAKKQDGEARMVYVSKALSYRAKLLRPTSAILPKELQRRAPQARAPGPALEY